MGVRTDDADDLDRLTDDRTMTIELRARRPDLTAMSERQLWERFEHLLPRASQELFAEHIFHHVHGDRAGRA